MVVNGKSSISVTRKMSWVVLVLGLISVILWLLVDSAGKASFGKQLASNESITSCSGNGMLVCPLGQCCTPAGSCGDCALKSASLEASEVGEYFARKTQFEYYILVLSFLGLGEWTIFSVLNMMTFRNVYKNPDSTTSKPAVIICAISYLLCRLIFLPFYVAGSYLSVPGYEAEQILIFKIGTIALAVWWNMIMIMPCLTIWYARISYGVGNELLGTTELPYTFVVILPVYNETIELLTEGVKSILDSNYEKKNITVHIAFDNDETSKLYLDFVQFLYSLQDTAVRYSEDEGTCNSQAPSLTGGYPESLCIVVNNIAVWVHKFPHGGKRLTQKKAWNFIQKQNLENPMTEEEKSRKIVLATDSDNFMYDNAIANLAYNFEKHPGKYAFAGYMTCMSSGWPAVLNPWRLIQDTEYVGGEMNRAFELCLGTVNCLPGGFTALRYSKFEQVAERYFTDLPDTTITDYHRNYLGEDRYLTHIMHQEFPRYSMGFCPAARCKTDPPTRLMGLVKQRRRWYLGALSNEAFMFTDRRIFEKYKLMVCYKFLSLCWWRSFTFTQIILASFLFHDIDFSSWEGIRMQALAVGIPFILNYLVICETGIKIHHYKVVWVALFSLLPQLFISFCVDVNVVMTFYQRSWGGARVEAAADKAKESGNSDDIDGLKEKLIERQNTPSDAFYRDPYIVVQLSSTETNSDSEQSYTSTESLNEFQRA